MTRFSRRTLLTGGVGLAGLGVGAAAVGVGHELSEPSAAGSTLPFFGDHQSGIVTPMQSHVDFVGLDLLDPTDHSALQGILRMWTQDAANLTQGRSGFSDTEPELAVDPARLSIAVGLGPRAFASGALAAKKPSWCQPLPAFGIDRLHERWGQTDVVVAVACDDPMTLAHAVRMVVAPVRRRTRVRWMQQGFHHKRNLFGQVDGTVQPAEGRYDDLVWDDGSEQSWMAGGTSLVLRRIAMNMDTWEAVDRPSRELSMGRTLDNGAPLTGDVETDDPVFTATKGGIPVIPESSHIARAHQRSDREQFLRRPYSYDLPPAGGDDTSDSGLIFAAYQRDPVAQYVPVQQRLADHDDLNEWTSPIGSAVYAMLPGARDGSYLGAPLFE
ncbi:Dyp-type peroxidase [Gordonia sp. HY002]|uniref:Dyp-type peroxidase n=1 Tax=Gordonia zhenghanii TaxID=2911516 RepID=UPI001EEFE4D4|nr:Dyp-type peroxidase [Gordonia zhenghanii]MCF8572314.1 Dyp-type peroxidase [Gordonia zhenghanii]MCF8606763.1 Dyp-type peroxidase [Gordonia zhenghanii]